MQPSQTYPLPLHFFRPLIKFGKLKSKLPHNLNTVLNLLRTTYINYGKQTSPQHHQHHPSPHCPHCPRSIHPKVTQTFQFIQECKYQGKKRIQPSLPSCSIPSHILVRPSRDYESGLRCCISSNTTITAIIIIVITKLQSWFQPQPHSPKRREKNQQTTWQHFRINVIV